MSRVEEDATLPLGEQPRNAKEPDEIPPVQGWDRYEIVSLLGQGGMGKVYKAFDPSLKRYVALKFLREDDPALVERFSREAQARIVHEHICKIYEVGEVQRKRYIAMQS